MKRFISGFVLGALIFAVPVLANNSKNIEAFYNNIKIKVYGQLVDTEGNEPFIVDGRTYVPARYVAEAMGGHVNWNAETNTVEVVKPEALEMTKLTSDGLEAEYRYDFLGYYLFITKITDKHNLTSVDVPGDNHSIKLITANSTKQIIVPVKIKNGLYVSLNDYETILLPALLN